jgi:hypothetical protein
MRLLLEGPDGSISELTDVADTTPLHEIGTALVEAYGNNSDGLLFQARLNEWILERREPTGQFIPVLVVGFPFKHSVVDVGLHDGDWLRF